MKIINPFRGNFPMKKLLKKELKDRELKVIMNLVNLFGGIQHKASSLVCLPKKIPNNSQKVQAKQE